MAETKSQTVMIDYITNHKNRNHVFVKIVGENSQMLRNDFLILNENPDTSKCVPVLNR